MRFVFQADDARPDLAVVEVDDRFRVALVRTAAGLRIDVFPIFARGPSIHPCSRFEVDEDEFPDPAADASDPPAGPTP